MSWPTPQDFNEAVQNPATNFGDEELRSGKVAVNSLDLPRVATGAFASVYKIRCHTRDLAVRCFLRQIPDVQDRYKKISDFVMSDDLPATVGFQYLDQGISVRNRWIPILKMDWVEGKTLDLFIRQNLTNAPALTRLAQQLYLLALDLKRTGIAHGDLQHGNILVTANGDLRLVDYDGMFVPTLKGQSSLELGHRNYQHPARDGTHFDERLDTFSIWCLMLSISCLIRDCTLVQQLSGLDECIIFRQSDFRYPLKSAAFALLESHNDAVIVEYSRRLRTLLALDPSTVPWIDENFSVPPNLPPLQLDRQSKVHPVHTVAQFETAREGNPTTQGAEWPTMKDYIDAVRRPTKAFTDPELKASTIVSDHGILSPISSDHGAVFKLQGEHGLIALKVFLKADEYLEDRYKALSSLVSWSKELQKYFVDFEYLPHGIKVGSSFYPAVKMPWIDSPTLFQMCEQFRGNRKLMQAMAESFRITMQRLQRAGIVHGDIDPSNLLYTKTGFILVDYDLTTVTPTRKLASTLKSNKHFRHRSVHNSQDYQSDNFAAWLIYTSLIALSYEPSLWNRLSVAPGRLLFERRDLKAPVDSLAFDLLRHHFARPVHELSENLSIFCTMRAEDTPPLPGELDLFDDPVLLLEQAVAPPLLPVPLTDSEVRAQEQRIQRVILVGLGAAGLTSILIPSTAFSIGIFLIPTLIACLILSIKDSITQRRP